MHSLSSIYLDSSGSEESSSVFCMMSFPVGALLSFPADGSMNFFPGLF
jgi:hypothetical protein